MTDAASSLADLAGVLVSSPSSSTIATANPVSRVGVGDQAVSRLATAWNAQL